MYATVAKPFLHTRPGSGLGIYQPYMFALPCDGSVECPCDAAAECGCALASSMPARIGLGQSILDDLGLTSSTDTSTGDGTTLLLLVAALGGGAWWYFTRKKKQQTAEDLDKKISRAQSRLSSLRAQQKAT